MVWVQSPADRPALAGGERGGLGADPAAGDGEDRREVLLLLFADTGGGHRASAMAVAREVAARHGDRYRCVLVRPFDELAPRLVGRAINLYSPLIRRAPWAWGLGWHATDNPVAVRAMRNGFLRFVEPGLAAEVDRLRPAALISFHPLLNHVSARVVRRAAPGRIPVITVVTDLVDIHASWTCGDVDAVVTPSPGGLDHCRRAGIPADRCYDLGLPIDRSFTEEAGSRAEARATLGLDPQAFTVLLSGGGEGSGGLYRRTLALLRERLDVHIVAICGRNSALQERLRTLSASGPTRLRVEGFVDNMALWLRAADIAVTKAGPGTIAEAMACGTPLLLTSYVPGQERGNVGFVVDTGSGRWVPGLREMVDAVRELAAPGSPALTAMRAELRHAARPAAAVRIADLVCALADRGVAAAPR
jgi:1,2-diacylglycerol 3-beta-galactosyltransferase